VTSCRCDRPSCASGTAIGSSSADPAASRVELSEFGPAPIDDWTCYPGRRPGCSYLFCGDHVRVGEPLDVDAALRALRAPSLAERTAVLAYGSNACPSQLARKYAGASSFAIPMTRALVHDLAIVFSDHETRYGSMPATTMPSAGASTEVFVAWLDDAQLEALDRSEARNYERRTFDTDTHALQCDGPSPSSLLVYESLRGVFEHEGVVPGVAGIDTTYQGGPILAQTQVRQLRRARRT
jgi:hypothetical protein